MYDPTTARWNGVDPMGEFYQSYSPYNYVLNNSLYFNDPTGMMPEPYGPFLATKVVNEETGEVIDIDDGFDFDFYVSAEEFAEIAEKGIQESSAYRRWFKEAATYTVVNGLSKALQRLWNLSKETGTQIDEAILDEAILDEAVSDALNGNYSTAAISLLLSRAKIPGLRNFKDLLAISKKLGTARKGKAQFQILEANMKEIFRELKKNGFKIQKRSQNAITLKNDKGKAIFIRKSKDGNFKTFDTTSSKVDGIQTDIRVPNRR